MKRILIGVMMVVGSLSFGAGTNSVSKAALPEKGKQMQCCAVTKSGNRCTRRSRPGERYCKQHTANVEVKKTPKLCCSITEKGVQCTRKPEPNRRYCKQHLGN